MTCQNCGALMLRCSEPVHLFGQEVGTCGAFHCLTCGHIETSNGTCALSSRDCPNMTTAKRKEAAQTLYQETRGERGLPPDGPFPAGEGVDMDTLAEEWGTGQLSEFFYHS